MNDLRLWLPTIIALAGIAAMWGRNDTTVTALKLAVDKLTAKLDTISALEKADAIHVEHAAHQREGLAAVQADLAKVRERSHAAGNAAQDTANRVAALERNDVLGHGLRGLLGQIAEHIAQSNAVQERLIDRLADDRRDSAPDASRPSAAPPFQPRRPTNPGAR